MLCLASAFIALIWSRPLEQSEFSGGRVTGPLLQVHEVAMSTFVFAAAFACIRPRIAAASSLLAAILAIPMYVYFIAPGAFRAVFRGEYSSSLDQHFSWHHLSAIAVLLLAAIFFVGCRLLRAIPRVANR